MSPERIYLFAVLAVALAAAGFDWRTGKIPNRLTLAAIVVAFPLHAYVSGGGAGAGINSVLSAMQWPLLGALICAVPPAIAWKAGWMGGGDVKLMAAMGALGGLSLGLECVFLGLLSAGAFILLRLAYSGTFLRTVGNGLAVAVTHGLRRKHPIAPAAELKYALRFGPFALAGVALSLLLHGGLA
jgi:prepilin peptidase CpaA